MFMRNADEDVHTKYCTGNFGNIFRMAMKGGWSIRSFGGQYGIWTKTI